MEFFEAAAVRYPAGALLISMGVALQFLPLAKKRLEPIFDRYPFLKIFDSRVVHLFVGFVLITAGIELLRMN
jgi:hypothetical protein